MDDAIFYQEWLPLDKKEFRILAMLADCDGEYHGNLTDMCRYFSISAQQKTRTALREAIQNLTEHNFIESSLSGRTFHLRLIPTDNEISLPRNWLTRLWQHKYSADSVSWEVIVKVILWLEENGHDVITNQQIADELNISDSVIVSAKKVLYKDFDGLLRKRRCKIVNDEFRCIGQVHMLSAWWKEGYTAEKTE